MGTTLEAAPFKDSSRDNEEYLFLRLFQSVVHAHISNITNTIAPRIMSARSSLPRQRLAKRSPESEDRAARATAAKCKDSRVTRAGDEES